MTTSPHEAGSALSAIAAARIRGLRAELRLSQAALALQSGLSRSALSDRESGVKPVNVDELPALAAALETSVEYLLGLSNDRSPGQVIPAGASSVRHQGLEPRTRCFGGFRPDLRIVGNEPWDGEDVEPLVVAVNHWVTPIAGVRHLAAVAS